MNKFKIGDRVLCDNGKGVVQFFGKAKFADGIWVGIALDEAKGENDGSVKDVRYFECPPDHGTFVRPKTVRLEAQSRDSVLPKSTEMKPTTTSARKSILPTKSPYGTPKMSPAVSMERLSKVGPSRKLSDAVKMHPLEENETDTKNVSNQEISAPQPTDTESLNETDRSFSHVKEQAKKIDQQPGPKFAFQRQDSQLTDVSLTPADDDVIRLLKEEIATLNDKLDVLRSERETDRLKLQYQNLLEYKTSMADEQRTLRRKLEELNVKYAYPSLILPALVDPIGPEAPIYVFDPICEGPISGFKKHFKVENLSTCNPAEMPEYPIAGLIDHNCDQFIVPLRVRMDRTSPGIVVYFVVDSGAPITSFGRKTYEKLFGNKSVRKVLIQDSRVDCCPSEEFGESIKDVNVLGSQFLVRSNSSLILSEYNIVHYGATYKIFYITPSSMISQAQTMAKSSKQFVDVSKKLETRVFKNIKEFDSYNEKRQKSISSDKNQ